jgi:hypothetical protein
MILTEHYIILDTNLEEAIVMNMNDDNLIGQIDRLKQKMDDKRNMTLEAKRASWGRIKAEVPDIAGLITSSRASFGPLAAVKVTIGRDTLVDFKV